MHDCEEFRIVHIPGAGSRAVVCFNGIKFRLGGAEVTEFRTALSGLDGHFYFVTDKLRHWYNGSFEAIAARLNQDLAEHGVTETITLGNSMGGFGALIFAGQLAGCRSCIAFAPPSAKAPLIVPWDTRNRHLAANVTEWAPLDATVMLVEHVHYTIIYGARDAIDVRHARRLADAGGSRVTVTMIAEAGHGVAKRLKKAGILYELIDGLIRQPGDGQDLRPLLGGLRHERMPPAHPASQPAVAS